MYFKISDYLAIPGSMSCSLLYTVYSLFNSITTKIIIIIYHIHFNDTFYIKIFGTLKKVPGDNYVNINNIYNIIFFFFCKLLSYISTILICCFCCYFVSFFMVISNLKPQFKIRMVRYLLGYTCASLVLWIPKA